MPERPLPTEKEVLGWIRDRRNWGRWGKDDQKGAMNLVTPAKRAAAARLVTSGRSVSLSRPFPKEPGPNNALPAHHYMKTHPRGKGGRFIEKNSPEAVAAARDAISKSLRQATPDSVGELLNHLNLLTVQQIHDLRREMGLKASGKNKEALVRKVAERLPGFRYLDTGAMYRAVTAYLLRIDKGNASEEEMGRAAEGLSLDGERLLVHDMDVTGDIRSAAVTAEVSRVSAVPRVRRVVQGKQRAVKGRLVTPSSCSASRPESWSGSASSSRTTVWNTLPGWLSWCCFSRLRAARSAAAR